MGSHRNTKQQSYAHATRAKAWRSNASWHRLAASLQDRGNTPPKSHAMRNELVEEFIVDP
jgi:hypothetical protein